MTPKPQFLAIGKLRRDVMFLGMGDGDEAQKVAEDAVKQGRAAEVFLLAVTGYFSESEQNFSNPDGTARLAMDDRAGIQLNPDAGEQPQPNQGSDKEVIPAPKSGTSTGVGPSERAASANDGQLDIFATGQDQSPGRGTSAEGSEAGTGAGGSSRSIAGDTDGSGKLDGGELDAVLNAPTKKK